MADTVDLVDIGPLFTDANQGNCDAALWAGLRRTGSVLVTGYPDANLIDRRARRGLELFGFAPEVIAPLITRLVAPGNANAYRAYWPSARKRLLQNIFFDIGPERPVPGPDLPGMEILTEPTLWPEGQEAWASTVRAHYDTLNRIALAMIASIGRSAGFDDAVIINRFAGSHSTLRFLDYPAGPGQDHQADGVALSAGEHTDASGLSLLWQGAPGLQTKGPDGIWRDIPVHTNAISVHVGDVMTRLTDGAVPATPHRVLGCDTHRQSVGFFLEPALSAPVTPASHTGPTSVRDTYAWQLLETFAARPIWNGVISPPSDTLRSSAAANPA